MAYDDTQGGRLSAITQGARTTSYGYYTPDTGFVKSITDPLGKTVTYSQRDPVGRITSTLLQDGTSTIASSYDLDGNLAKLTPPAGAAHGFDYTPIDLLHDYLPPNLGFSGNTTYAYNADRQLLSMVDPDGTITRTYDSAGRLSTVTFGPYSTTYGYDAADRLATVQTADGEVVTYGYDGSLRVSETWTGPVSGSVAQTFDNYFRLSTRTVMGTSPVTYGYDGRSAQERGSALRSAGPRRPDERAPGGHDRGRSDRCVDLRLRRPTDELHGAVRRRYAVLRDVHAGPRRARLDEDRGGLGRHRARLHVHVHRQGRA
jgi:YD repeat-containing protein